MIHITSDLHLCHNKPFLYEPRGFESIEEHDIMIVNNWNSVVSAEDKVYILGDLTLKDIERGIELLSQLNGDISYIIGNHDTDNKIKRYEEIGLKCLGYASILKDGKWRFYLSHYPTLCSNYDDKIKGETINLCGHTHTKDKFLNTDKGIIYHCELDAHNCFPVSLENIKEDLRNYYGKERFTKESLEDYQCCNK